MSIQFTIGEIAPHRLELILGRSRKINDEPADGAHLHGQDPEHVMTVSIGLRMLPQSLIARFHASRVA